MPPPLAASVVLGVAAQLSAMGATWDASEGYLAAVLSEARATLKETLTRSSTLPADSAHLHAELLGVTEYLLPCIVLAGVPYPASALQLLLEGVLTKTRMAMSATMGGIGTPIGWF